MSSLEKDRYVDAIEDWFAQIGYKEGGICINDKGVFVFVSGEKRYMPELLADVWKLL